MAMQQAQKPPNLLRSIAIDCSIVVGWGLVTYGAWQIYAPVGFVVAGVMLLAVGLLGARR